MNNNKKCVTTCTNSFYADATTLRCVEKCPDKSYGDVATQVCQSACTGTLYADPIANMCAEDCPEKYRKALTSNICLGDCGEGEYYDTIADGCTATCPDGYYPDLETMQCRSFDYSCVDQYCIKTTTHLCTKMTVASTFIARQTSTYFCAKVNQQVGIDQCLGLEEYARGN